MARTGIIILAAGNSSRLGRPKQLLQIGRQTLLKKITAAALSLYCGPVIVVLGNYTEELLTECDGAVIAINHNWAQGMAGSIAVGLNRLQASFPNVTGVIIAVCDQPFVTASLLQQLIAVYDQTQKPIVAAAYKETAGTPAYFHHTLFDELMQLKGDRGAKQIILKHESRLALVDFPGGEMDVDTEEDYIRLLQSG